MWNFVSKLNHVLLGTAYFFFQPSGYVLFRDYATGDLAQVDLLIYFFPCPPVPFLF